VSLPFITLTERSIIMEEGDSRTDAGFPYQDGRTLREQCRARYGVRGRTPIFINKAINGSTIGNVAARIDTNLLENPYTHVNIEIGINNYNAARATTRANWVTVLDFCLAAGVQVLARGPYARGELFPSGQNTGPGTGDAAIDNTAADMGIIVNGGTTTDLVTYPGYPNVCWCDLRSTEYVVTMPPLNQPPPGASTGPFTVDGIHENPFGRAGIWQRRTLPFVRFS
jgi:hypothetical protein